MEHDYTIEIDGRVYEQDFLPAEKALRLHHKVLRLGFVPVGQAVASHLDAGGKVQDFGSKEGLTAQLAQALYGVIQVLEPEDVEALMGLLSQVTWVKTGDGVTTQRLDQAKGHFKDARDMARMYRFLFRSIQEQLRPLLSDLRTMFGA